MMKERVFFTMERQIYHLSYLNGKLLIFSNYLIEENLFPEPYLYKARPLMSLYCLTIS
jgi:hypothetical protein